MRNWITLTVFLTTLATFNRAASAQSTDPSGANEDRSHVSPLACLHTMLEYNTAGAPGPTEGKMPTMLNTNPAELLFKDEAGAIYTIEWPHLYKLNVDPKTAKPGHILITDLRTDHQLHHTSPTSVWQFVTPRGVPLTIHSAFQGRAQDYGVRGRDDDLNRIAKLIEADQGMKTASENALQAARCDDGVPTLSDKISDLAAPLNSVGIGPQQTRVDAKKELNDFNKQFAAEQVEKYKASIAEQQKWKKDLDETKAIAPQPNSAVQLQSADVEKQLASDMIPALKSQLDETVISKDAAAAIKKYCGSEMLPKEKPLTDGQKAKNNILSSIQKGAGAPFLDAFKESNAPQ